MRLVTSLLLVDLSIIALVLRHVALPGDLPLVVLAAGLGIAAVVVAIGGRRTQASAEAPTGSTDPAPLSWTVRALLYLALTIVLVVVAGLFGLSYGDGQCVGEGDCPEAIVGSLLFGFGALVTMAILIASCEFTLRSRRSRLAQ